MIDLIAVLLVFIGSIMGSYGTLLFKKVSKKISFLDKRLIMGFLLHGISALLYITALKREKLSILYPLISLNYVWVSIFSIKFLKEKMNFWKWLGIFVIIAGVVFIGVSS